MITNVLPPFYGSQCISDEYLICTPSLLNIKMTALPIDRFNSHILRKILTRRTLIQVAVECQFAQV